jgi:hypothetical protein
MKKILIFMILILSLSCGVLLDEPKIEGIWTLSGVEFYVYNALLDANKTYVGVNRDDPTGDSPVIGEFFGYKKDTYTIEFKSTGYNFIVTRSDHTPDTIVDIDRASWSLNTFENSLTLKVKGDNSDANFWNAGFKLKNYWPLVNNQTLEILIKDSDVGAIYVEMPEGPMRVNSMKGTFTRE